MDTKSSAYKIRTAMNLYYAIGDNSPNEIKTSFNYDLLSNLMQLSVESKGIKLEGKVRIPFTIPFTIRFLDFEKKTFIFSLTKLLLGFVNKCTAFQLI